MNKLIFHIGSHKTATSYLQTSYFPSLTNTIVIKSNQFFREWNDYCYKEVDNLLVSYEGFSGFAWNEDWKKGIKNSHNWLDSFNWQVENIYKFFPEAVILIVFRRHGDFLVSMYKQYIQEGGTLSFDAFYGDKRVISKDNLSYRNRIEKIRSLFKNYYILSYEDYRNAGDEFFDRFFIENFGITRENIANKSINHNKSISGNKIELLRKINKPYYKLPKKLRGFLRYIRVSPRDILQNKLSFWNPQDPSYLIEAKERINKEMEDDWAYVEEVKWKYSVDK